MGVSSLSFSFGSARTEGTIIKVEEDLRYHGGGSGTQSGRTWYPVVEYQVGGSKYTHTGPGSSEPHFTVGQTLGVLYKVDRPAVACLDSFVDRWLFPMVFSGVGAMFAASGAVVVWKSPLQTA
jgi:hypothetical protein